MGELLQPGGVHALEKLGLVHCLDGIDAIAVRGYGVFADDNERQVHLPYPMKPQVGKEATEQEWGKSFHHGRFIMQLRQSVLNHDRYAVCSCWRMF